MTAPGTDTRPAASITGTMEARQVCGRWKLFLHYSDGSDKLICQFSRDNGRWAQRIAQCLNACEGMADPSAIRAARGQL